MQVLGLEGLPESAIQAELGRGGRFVFYEYCISFIFITFRRASPIYFLPGTDAGWWKACKYSLVSVLLGWWGLPWGVILTPLTVITNLTGGKDVTEMVWARLQEQQAESA
jgi:hypothetical protein